MTINLIADEDVQPEEDIQISSINHALVQTHLIRILPDDQFTIATELSLDVSSPERQAILKKYHVKAERELKPDICLYNAQDLDYLDPELAEDDIARLEKVPLLCIEIVSPSQASLEILRKFRVYFAMGVKSCWYVDPNLKLVKIYSSLQQSKSFEEGEVFDSVLNIHLPLNKIFFKKSSYSNKVKNQ
ncbi:MAG: Uma2 family endonuclease [Thioploca sp.]|nr:Uma2 family endonuclease [Thioploca sp.]